jgi:hypothetical protein
MAAGVLILYWASGSRAADIETKYATITYHDQQDLRRFNDKLDIGRYSYQVKAGLGDTIESEIISKIDFIVEKVMAVLDMFPVSLKFSIVIRPTEKEVQKDFRDIYRVDVTYIAFYSPNQNKVFYSVDNANIKVVAHEIGHVIVENYFNISPPQRIHEVLAQFAAKHIMME